VKYPISVEGLSAGSVGVTDVTASGKVYHLAKLADFEGNYTAASAGVTVGGGGSVTTMGNQNGVVINLVSTTQCLKFLLAAGG
jgi:DMSO reductase anchor subunit